MRARLLPDVRERALYNFSKFECFCIVSPLFSKKHTSPKESSWNNFSMKWEQDYGSNETHKSCITWNCKMGIHWNFGNKLVYIFSMLLMDVVRITDYSFRYDMLWLKTMLFQYDTIFSSVGNRHMRTTLHHNLTSWQFITNLPVFRHLGKSIWQCSSRLLHQPNYLCSSNHWQLALHYKLYFHEWFQQGSSYHLKLTSHNFEFVWHHYCHRYYHRHHYHYYHHWLQWRSQGLSGCPTGGPKWGRKWEKIEEN